MDVANITQIRKSKIRVNLFNPQNLWANTTQTLQNKTIKLNEP